MSAQAWPPPASINMAWVNTFPRSWTGTRSPAHGTAADNTPGRRSRSAKAANACNPDQPAGAVAAALDLHPNCASSLHLTGALLMSPLDVPQLPEKPTNRAPVASQVPRVIPPRERS